jgi:threonine aldolase
MIDLRSDTVTKPSAAMRAFMMEAEVGDDVFGEDPSINALEEKVCALFGTEAAMFAPTATMSNQIALKILTHPLDEIICDRTSHIYNYEVGGYAFHSGCSIRYLQGERGIFTAEDVIKNINPEDVHKSITRLVSLENTSNRGGGKTYPIATIRAIKQVCDNNNLFLHLDGSRVMNAIVASGDNPQEYGQLFDTITICFSKGLGCPMGSVLTGKKIHMDKARRVRKVFGGGMRQAGIMAAAAIYALDNNVQRLADDHTLAQQIASVLTTMPYVSEMLSVETNIVIFRLQENVSDNMFIAHLAQHDIHAFAIGDNWVRFVTHLDIKADDLSAITASLQQFKP